MKKYLIAFMAFILMTAAANAQTKENAAGNMQMHRMNHFHHRHGGMMSNLNFTDSQKQQLKSINENYKSQLSTLEKNDNITLKDYRAQKAALQKDKQDKFQALLTPDQKNKIEEGKKKMHEKMQMMAQKRLDKMKTDLSLSDDQVAKIKSQRDDMMNQSKSIMENSSLSKEEKKEQVMNLRKASKNNINNILTADQLKKKEELRKERINDWKNKKDSKAS